MTWQVFYFSNVTKIAIFIFVKVSTICVNRIRSDFTKPYTMAANTFKGKPETANAGEKVYEAEICHLLQGVFIKALGRFHAQELTVYAFLVKRP